jgi:hypothetical protein
VHGGCPGCPPGQLPNADGGCDTQACSAFVDGDNGACSDCSHPGATPEDFGTQCSEPPPPQFRHALVPSGMPTLHQRCRQSTAWVLVSSLTLHWHWVGKVVFSGCGVCSCSGWPQSVLQRDCPRVTRHPPWLPRDRQPLLWSSGLLRGLQQHHQLQLLVP